MFLMGFVSVMALADEVGAILILRQMDGERCRGLFSGHRLRYP